MIDMYGINKIRLPSSLDDFRYIAKTDIFLKFSFYLKMNQIIPISLKRNLFIISSNVSCLPKLSNSNGLIFLLTTRVKRVEKKTRSLKISNGNNFFSNGPIGLKFCRHGKNINTSMPAKFQPNRTIRKKSYCR